MTSNNNENENHRDLPSNISIHYEGHWLVRSGYQDMLFRCPRCKIPIEGPVIIEKGGVHFVGTWSMFMSHELVDIASSWQRRLIELAEIPINKLCIHIEYVDLNIDPLWSIEG